MPTRNEPSVTAENAFDDRRARRRKLLSRQPAKVRAAAAPETPHYTESCPVKNRTARRQWAKQHDFCQVCGIPQRDACWARITGLQTHHIIKPGRSDEPCNLLRVCAQCHDLIEGERIPDGKGGYFPQLTLAHMLYCKRAYDPHEYDPDRLTMLWRNRQRSTRFDPLPPPEPLPEALLEERRRWRPATGLSPTIAGDAAR